MTIRPGRPRTGTTPIFAARVNKSAANAARRAARATGKRLGKWLEEAIREKLAKEKRLPDTQPASQKRGREK